MGLARISARKNSPRAGPDYKRTWSRLSTKRLQPVYNGALVDRIQDRANREMDCPGGADGSPDVVELSAQLADVYHRPWPAGRLRVDSCCRVAPTGAYTSLAPTQRHTFQPRLRNQGIYGLKFSSRSSPHALQAR